MINAAFVCCCSAEGDVGYSMGLKCMSTLSVA